MAPRARGRGPGEKPAARVDLAQAERFRTLVERTRRLPALSAGELRVLIEQAASGDRAARERLFNALVDRLLRLAAARRDQGLSLEDLFQEGTVALMAAIDDYAESGRSDFEAYLEERVDQGMEAALTEERAAVAATARLVQDAADFDRVQMLLARSLRRVPSDREVAEKLEWPEARAAAVRVIVEDARRRHDEEILAYLEPRDPDEGSGTNGAE